MGTLSIRPWDGDTFSCSRNTKHGSVACRSRCIDDCRHFRPVDGAYSPYGVLYGFSSNLIEHMALKTLQPDAVTHFSLEDVFVDGDADKLAWVSGWRKLPHITPESGKAVRVPPTVCRRHFRSDRAGAAQARFRWRGERWCSNRAPVHSARRMIHRLIRRSLLIPESYDETQLLNDRREGEFFSVIRRQADGLPLQRTSSLKSWGRGTM